MVIELIWTGFRRFLWLFFWAARSWQTCTIIKKKQDWLKQTTATYQAKRVRKCGHLSQLMSSIALLGERTEALGAFAELMQLYWCRCPMVWLCLMARKYMKAYESIRHTTSARQKRPSCNQLVGSVRWVGQNHGQKQVLSHKSQVRWSNPAPKSHKIIYDRYAKCLGVPKNPIPSPKRWKNDAPLCSPLFWWWLIFRVPKSLGWRGFKIFFFMIYLWFEYDFHLWFFYGFKLWLWFFYGLDIFIFFYGFGYDFFMIFFCFF